MGKQNLFVTPIVVGGISFGLLYTLAELPQIRAWFLNHKEVSPFLDQIQIKLNGILSASLGTIFALVKWYLDPAPPGTAPVAIPLPPENPGRDWRRAYHDLYARASALLQERNMTKAVVQDELYRVRGEVLERRAAMKLTLYSGLVFAMGSCVAAAIFRTEGAGSQSPKLVTHFLVLIGVYFCIALIFAFGALVHRGRPYRRVPLLMFGVAAGYVNLCTLLISVPYTVDRLLDPSNPRVLGFPIVVGIGVSRLILEPFAAVAGTVFGTILAGACLRVAQTPQNQDQTAPRIPARP